MRKNKPIVARTPEDLARVLGLPTAEAKEWRLQHELVKRLKDVVRREKLTHTEIARRARTSRTRVTAILNDNLDGVSSDLLVRILGALGYGVRVSLVRLDIAA